MLRVRSVSREEVWLSAGVQGAWVGGCGCEADKGVFVFVESEALFVVALPRRGYAMLRMTPVFVRRPRRPRRLRAGARAGSGHDRGAVGGRWLRRDAERR